MARVFYAGRCGGRRDSFAGGRADRSCPQVKKSSILGSGFFAKLPRVGSQTPKTALQAAILPNRVVARGKETVTRGPW